jgi:hypothetical protein
MRLWLRPATFLLLLIPAPTFAQATDEASNTKATALAEFNEVHRGCSGDLQQVRFGFREKTYEVDLTQPSRLILTIYGYPAVTTTLNFEQFSLNKKPWAPSDLDCTVSREKCELYLQEIQPTIALVTTLIRHEKTVSAETRTLFECAEQLVDEFLALVQTPPD